MVSGRGREVLPPSAFSDFGTLLRVLRLRARLKQRDLGIAVGYSEAQISRLEQGKRLPDPSVIAALFVPALGLRRDPELAARLHELAQAARDAEDTPVPVAADPAAPHHDDIAAIPAMPRPHVGRPAAAAGLAGRLAETGYVLLCGPPGAGKTTLAAKIARDLAPARPVCWLTLTAGITTPAEAVIRRLARCMDRSGQPGVAPLLDPGQVDRPLPFDEQMYLLATALSHARAAVFLDNAHLLAAEDRTRTVVEHLAAASRAGFVAISREAFQLDGFSLLRLGGLDREQARTLIGQLAGDRLPARLAGRLIDRTDGSPMLIRLALGSVSPADPDQAEPDPAATVERLEEQPAVSAYLLEAVLSGLGEPARLLTELIAVFRHPVDLLDTRLLEASQAAEGPYDVNAGLDQLRRRQLVDHAARASLHPLVRDRVYAGLAGRAGRRRGLHRIAAAHCEHALADPLEAAWHYTRAGERTEAADLLTASVPALISRGRSERAAELITELLGGQADGDGLAGDGLAGDGLAGDAIRLLLVARGDFLLHTEQSAIAEQSYRDALARPGPPAVRAGIAWRLAQCLLQRGQLTEALRLSTEAEADLPADDDVLRAQLTVVRSQARLMLSDFAVASALAREACDRADRIALVAVKVAEQIRCRAFGVLGVAARLRGEPGEAGRLLGQSLAAARACGHAEMTGRALFNLAAVAHEQGELVRAERLYAEALAQMRSIGDGYGAARVLHALGMIRHQGGAADEAMAQFLEAIALRRRLGDVQGAAHSEHAYSLVLLWLGRTTEARELLLSALDSAAATGERRSLGHFLDSLAMIALVDGDIAAADSYLDQAGEIAAAIGERRLAGEVLQHRALARLADPDIAAAERLMAEPGDAGQGVSAELHRLSVAACIALAAGDRAVARARADELGRRASLAGFVPEAGAAARIAAAASAAPAPPSAGYPRLIWVSPALDPSLTIP